MLHMNFPCQGWSTNSSMAWHALFFCWPASLWPHTNLPSETGKTRWERGGGGGGGGGGAGNLRLHAGKELLICSITSARSELLLWESNSSSEHIHIHTHIHFNMPSYHSVQQVFICRETVFSVLWSMFKLAVCLLNAAKRSFSYSEWIAVFVHQDQQQCECLCWVCKSGSPEFSVSGPRSCTVGEDTPFTLESTSGWEREREEIHKHTHTHTEKRKQKKKENSIIIT